MKSLTIYWTLPVLSGVGLTIGMIVHGLQLSIVVKSLRWLP